MTSTAHPPRRRAPGLRAVALVALASVSCTTVRVPASGISASVPIRGDAAEPQVELWLESGHPVSPGEAAQASAEARAALEQALATRRLGEGDQLLVVREQGVARTSSRRADQNAAIAGIVVGAVAIVAIVVVALVATGGKGGGGGGKVPAIHAPSGAARPAAVAGGVRVAPVPVAVPRPPLPSSPPAVAVAPPRPVRGPAGGAPHVAVNVGADVQIYGPGPSGGPAPAVYGDDAVVELAAPPPAYEADAVAEVVLAPPPPLEVTRRGFFAKDTIRLELTLVDRATGTPLWVKTVEKQIDPRDARAVRELLDAALNATGGWEPAAAFAPASS